MFCFSFSVAPVPFFLLQCIQETSKPNMKSVRLSSSYLCNDLVENLLLVNCETGPKISKILTYGRGGGCHGPQHQGIGIFQPSSVIVVRGNCNTWRIYRRLFNRKSCTDSSVIVLCSFLYTPLPSFQNIFANFTPLICMSCNHCCMAEQKSSFFQRWAYSASGNAWIIPLVLMTLGYRTVLFAITVEGGPRK
jgi:hypothetical protein